MSRVGPAEKPKSDQKTSSETLRSGSPDADDVAEIPAYLRGRLVNGEPADSDAEEAPFLRLPAGLEATILGELNRPITGGQTGAQRQRWQRLLDIFHSIAPPWRNSLAARMTRPRRDDALIASLRGKLSHMAVQSLLAALRGDATAMPPGDAIAGVAASQLRVHPASIVLDTSFAPQTDLTLSIEAPEGPGVEGPPVQILWRIDVVGDPDERSIAETMPWPAALPAPDKFVLRIDRAGRRRVRCDITQDGLLIASLADEIDVEQTRRSGEADKKQVEDVVAAMVIPEEELRTGQSSRTQQLAQSDLTSEQRLQLGDERNSLEFAASQRGVELERNLDPGPEAIQVGGFWVSADPVFLRNKIEEYYIKGGWRAVEWLELWILFWIARGDPSGVEDQTAWRKPLKAILDGFRQQRRQIKEELDAFTGGFGELARKQAIKHLLESKERVDSERERYGLSDAQAYEWDRAYGDPSNDPTVSNYPFGEQADTPDAEEMARTAVQLASEQRELEDLRWRLTKVEREASTREYGYRGGEFGDYTPLDEFADRGDEEIELLYGALIRVNGKAEEAHTRRVQQACEKFPFLASYKKASGGYDGRETNIDAEGLDKLGDVSSRTGAINSRSLDVLDKIERTVSALEGYELSVWKEPRVLQMAKAAALVLPGSLRDRAVNDKAASENEMSWTDWALLAITFALVAITFIPTGGSSALVALGVAAEVGMAVIGTYQALESLRKYEIGMAATGTDFDKAKAISADEPSLFWLAVDVVGAALDIGSAMKAFGKLIKARKAVSVGMAATEFDETLALVHAEANQGRVTAEGALQLEDEMRAAAGLTDEAAEAGGDLARAADELDSAALPGRASGVDTRARVSEHDAARLEEQLGAKVVFDDGLDDGVSVVGKVADNGDIYVDLVRVGKNALVADILAHRRTIARLTRYNGLVGSLRKMWDNLVALAGGRIIHQNPFTPGTLVHNSFEEVYKLQGLIEQRRALLLGDTVDPRILDEEIAFLSGEVAHHQDVVRGAGETLEFSPSGVFVERPRTGQRTQEAMNLNYPMPKEYPEHYYYRLSDTRPDVYELALKPNAPRDLKLPSWHAEVVLENGVVKATGNLLSGRPKRIERVFNALDSDADVVAHVRKMEGFDNFAGSLIKNSLYNEDEIAEVILRLRKDGVTDEFLRREAKEIFRQERVLPHLLDESIGQLESFKRMESLLSPMGVADRGNLAELWYQSRFAKKSEHHVATAVARTSEDGLETVLEDRVIDFFGDGVATEVKSGASAIDHDQFHAYLAMVEQKALTVGKKAQSVTGVKYVFLDTVGATENLPWIAKQVRNKKLDHVVVEAFDGAGRRHVLSTADEMDEFVARFGGK